MLNYTLKELEIFEAVARNNSFSQAAAELFLSQSTVSSAIANLEQELNLVLFDRTAKKKMSLTETGEKKFHEVQELLRVCNAFSEQCETREIKIGASTIPSLALIPDLIAKYSLVNPNCAFTVRDTNSAGVYDMLRGGDVMLGFTGNKVDNPNLVYTPLLKDELLLITPDTAEFRSLKQAGCYGIDLLKYPMILRESGSGTNLSFMKYLTKKKIPADEIPCVARMSSPKAIENAVSAGLGIAVVSNMSIHRRQNGILRFPMDAEGCFRTIWLVYLKHAALSTACKDFIDYLLKVYCE